MTVPGRTTHAPRAPRAPLLRRCGGPAYALRRRMLVAKPPVNELGGPPLPRRWLDAAPEQEVEPPIPPPPPPPRRRTTDKQQRPGTAEKHTLVAHIEMLWQHHMVPSHHRELFTLRYFKGGCSRQFLLQEASALASGTASVQVAENAVNAREQVLDALVRLRLAHSDSDIQNGTGAAYRNLAALLRALRMASAHAVDAICVWRRCVVTFAKHAGAIVHRPSSTVAGLSARGACWPHGGQDVDYLWTMVHDDAVVRTFASVLKLSPVCDPFLIFACGEVPTGAQLSLPSMLNSVEFDKVEAAKMLLLEEEVATLVLGKRAESKSTPTGATTASPGDVSASDCVQLVEQTPRGEDGGLNPPPKALLPSVWPLRVAGNARPASARSWQSPAHSHVRREQPLRPRSASSTGCRNTWKRAQQRTNTFEGGEEEMQGSEQQQDTITRTATAGHDDDHFFRRTNARGVVMADVDMAGLLTAAKAPPSALQLALTQIQLEDDAADDDQECQAQLQHYEGIFRKFADDGSIHLDDMEVVLEHAGLGKVDMAMVDICFKEITPYTTMCLYEFSQLITSYQARQRESYDEQFNKFDADGSGCIDSEELGALLTSLCVEPMEHVLDEVIAEVDKDGNNTVDLKEFYVVMNIVYQREGFCRSEYELFLQTFEKFDADHTDSMDSTELSRLLAYLGFALDEHVVESVVMQVDVDRSGTVNRNEFLIFMRKVRDHMIQNLKIVMDENDADNSGTIDACELKDLLSSVGYFPNEQVIEQVGVDVDIDVSQDELNLSQLWRFLYKYRKREGLSNEDIALIEKSYCRYLTKHGTDDGELGMMHIGKVLRSLGFSLTFEEQQTVRTQVDVDGSGSLSLDEVYKMIRLCREQEIIAAVRAFKEKSSTGLLLVSEAQAIFMNLGCVDGCGKPPKTSATEVSENGLAIDLASFVGLLCKQNESNRHDFRNNGGFSEEELLKLSSTFSNFDEDGSGDIGQDELVTLIQVFFPKLASDPKLRPKLVELIAEADEDGGGTLNFRDFLHLMQLCRDQHDGEQLQKERTAIEATDFTAAEVNEFRDVFTSCDGFEEGHLPVRMLLEQVALIVRLGEKRASEFLLHLEMTRRFNQLDDTDATKGVDFPEFLLIMRWILDSNFGNVKEQTDGAAAKYRAELGARQVNELEGSRRVAAVPQSHAALQRSMTALTVQTNRRRSDMVALVDAGERRASQRKESFRERFAGGISSQKHTLPLRERGESLFDDLPEESSADTQLAGALGKNGSALGALRTGGLRDIEEENAQKACACGNVFMTDAVFCRKCGQQRTD